MSPDEEKLPDEESCGQSCFYDKKILVPDCNTLAYRKGNQNTRPRITFRN